MISYNKGGNIVITEGLPRVPVADLDAFKLESFEHFCKESAPRIIKEYYEPSINRILKSANIRAEIVDICVDKGVKIDFAKYNTQKSSQEYVRDTKVMQPYTVYGRFQLYPIQGKSIIDYTELNKTAEVVELLSLPYVENGLIIYDRYETEQKKFKKHAYNFIPQIELAPSLSKGIKNEVVLRCASGKSLIFFLNGKGQIRVRLDKRKHIPFAAITAQRLMSEYHRKSNGEGTNIPIEEGRKVLKSIPEIIHYYGLLKTDDQPYFEGFGSYASLTSRDGKPVKRIDTNDLRDKVMPLFKGPDAIFTADGLRGALNEYLSLYRAVGCISSKDVTTTSGSVILRAGDVITSEAVDELYKNDIYVIHVVQEAPISVYTNNLFWVDFIPQGTKNYPFLREHLKSLGYSEDGLYISKDYELRGTAAVTFPKNTEINKDIWNFLREVNYNIPISVRPTKSSNNIFDLYLDREIVSNYYKPAGDSYEDWNYVGPQGYGSDGTNSLTFGDMFALYSFIPQVLNNLFTGWLPNADACFIKRLTTIDDAFSRALQETCVAGFYYNQTITQAFKTHPEYLMRNDTVANHTFKLYPTFMRRLKAMKCIEMVDSKVYVNPIAYESAKHKANIYVGNKHAIADDQRKMALNSYGIFDAYEVPQSGRLGIVNQLTTTCKLTHEGYPLVAYYKVSNGRVDFNNLVWLDAQQESRAVIADIGSLKLDGNKILNLDEIVNCRVPAKSAAKSNIEPQLLRNVQYVNADPNCTLGYACGSIPFANSNDAVRATFAVAQIKEAKPTENNEPAGITTTIMSQLEQRNNPFYLRAEDDGVLCSLDTTDNSTRAYRLSYLRGSVRDKGTNKKNYVGWTDLGGAESLTRLKLNYPIGKPFHKGDVLMTSQFVNEKGEFCTGLDTLVGYISDGHNYEDGVSIMPAFSERATSISIHEEDVYEGSAKPEFIPIENRYYHKGETITIRLAGRSNTTYKHVMTVAGYHYDTEILVYENRHQMKMKFLSYEPARVGDKFSDRNGNKGVCTYVYKEGDAYTLANGVPIEMLRNPLGVATRLNIGQLKECRLSWARVVLGVRIAIDSFSHNDGDVDMLVKIAYRLANMDSAEAAIAPFKSELPQDLINLCYERHEEAQKWRGVFDEQGACEVWFNGMKRPTKAYVGYIHTLKLVQEVRSKIAYRGGMAEGEQYVSRTNAPTKGRKQSGGQRLGSMEIAAYCAYGAEHWLNELFSSRSDDGAGRVAFAMDKYYGDKSFYKYPSQRRAVTELVVSLAAMGIELSGTDGELIDVMSLQSRDFDYPRLNTIRKDITFGKFNRPKHEQKKLVEDDIDTDLYTEEEMLNWSVLWDFFGWDRLHDPDDSDAQGMLYAFLRTPEERDKFFRTMERRGMK